MCLIPIFPPLFSNSLPSMSHSLLPLLLPMSSPFIFPLPPSPSLPPSLHSLSLAPSISPSPYRGQTSTVDMRLDETILQAVCVSTEKNKGNTKLYIFTEKPDSTPAAYVISIICMYASLSVTPCLPLSLTRFLASSLTYLLSHSLTTFLFPSLPPYLSPYLSFPPSFAFFLSPVHLSLSSYPPLSLSDPMHTSLTAAQKRAYYYQNCQFEYVVTPPTYKNLRHSFRKLTALLEESKV